MSKITLGLKLCLSFNWISEFQVSGTPAFFLKILLRVNGKSDFKFIDEYENPTEHSTGGHFHMAYIGSSSVYAKKKAAGELPEVIPGTNKVVNSDGSDVAINTWSGEDENGTDLAELDNILKQFASKQKGKSSADMIKFTAGDEISHKWEKKKI